MMGLRVILQKGFVVNDLVNSTQKKILDILDENNSATYEQLAKAIGVSPATIKRNVKKLCDMGLIRRIGSDKTGHWEVRSK